MIYLGFFCIQKDFDNVSRFKKLQKLIKFSYVICLKENIVIEESTVKSFGHPQVYGNVHQKVYFYLMHLYMIS